MAKRLASPMPQAKEQNATWAVGGDNFTKKISQNKGVGNYPKMDGL